MRIVTLFARINNSQLMIFESITAVNNGLVDFKGVILFASHDHQFVQTIANRIIELKDEGCVDRICTFDEYMEFSDTMD